MSCIFNGNDNAGIILGMRSVSERQIYNVTTSLTDWAHKLESKYTIIIWVTYLTKASIITKFFCDQPKAPQTGSWVYAGVF